MSWKIEVVLKGDEPSEQEVEEKETELTQILDDAGFEYLDVGVR